MSQGTYPLSSLLAENQAAKKWLDETFPTCAHCDGDRKIRCIGPECLTCALDFYCENAEACACSA